MKKQMKQQNQKRNKKPTRSTRKLTAVYSSQNTLRPAVVPALGQTRFDFETLEEGGMRRVIGGSSMNSLDGR